MASDWHDRIMMVIPSINGGHLLERMLPTLRFRPSNVIVLDQGSSDDTERICQEAGVELLQLGRPHTYTEACNIGAQIARQRNYPFLCVSNNDIVFRTDVLSELLAEMERDTRLGIVAPSQIILDPASGVDALARRVFWNLETLEFLHDLDASLAPPRIEADFCELTCALIRMSVLEEVGFLDDAFGFYHEDADFCFRLREAGYGAAYLPRSQIYHFTGSTFSQKRQMQIDHLYRNKTLFAKKHLGYGVHHVEDRDCWTGETEIVGRRLHPVLRRFGLIDDNRPDLLIGRMGAMTTGYLFTTQRSVGVQTRWLALRDRYRAILATSDAVVHSLRSAGFTSFHVPLGIDPDLFNPWDSVAGPATRRLDETTYLAIADPHDHRPLATLLQAWSRFTALGHRARLIVVGSRLVRRMGRTADAAYRSGRLEISCYSAEQLELHETASPLRDEELALLYRSVDFTILAEAEGSSLTLLESLASGTPVVFDAACSSVATLYSDATGGVATLHAKVGESQPSDGITATADGLLAALERSERLSAAERKALAMAASYGVLGHSTLRHTAMALRHALEMTQERESDRFARRLERRLASPPNPEILSQKPAATPLRPRLSGAAARLLTTAATRATLFGTVWQHRGLPAAVALSAARIRLAATHRIRPAPASPRAPARPARSALKAPKKASTLLIGYIDAQLGIGQSLRGLAFAMAEAGTPFGIYPFGLGVEGRRSIPTMPERYDEVTPHDVNIIEVSPAELPRVFGHVSEDHFDGSYNILRTYWELAKGPVAWRQNHGMDRIDEIWAPNAFCATAFRDFFDGPIVIVPPCLGIADPLPNLTQDGRNRFGLDPDVFYFMFSFDYYSFPDRKNPLGVIRAFRTAFPEFDRPVGLVVKATSDEKHFPAIKKEILSAARADGRIAIIDTSLSRQDMLSLMASIDCYVSLHRSEGFGLGMAEAMALEKPVIATDYSASCEFVTESTGYPIPFTLMPVRPHEYVHSEGQVWADPDEDACAAAMRNVIDNPDQAASRAKAGRAFVDCRYGARNVGRLAAERLEDIRLSRSAKTPVGSIAV
jgi:GT2 family glycosyltransferase